MTGKISAWQITVRVCSVLLFAFLAAVAARVFLPEEPQGLQAQKLRTLSIQKKDYSIAGQRRLEYAVFLDVTGPPSELDLQHTAAEFWKENKGQDKFWVHFYLPDMTKGNGAYAVADFTRAGLEKFFVNPDSTKCTRWHPEIGPDHEWCREITD